MIEIIIIVIIIILAPFFVYLLSKIQMLGWIAGINAHLILEERNQKNGQETEDK